MSVNDVIMGALVENGVDFVTTVPCKQLAGVIEKIEQASDIYHIPANREDEGMGLCAGAYLGKASRYHNAEYSNRCNNQFANSTDSILPDAAAYANQLSRRGG